ncbi:MAG: TAXI family TRAP transporter solute-binding subunit [Spirochaetota bacterium]
MRKKNYVILGFLLLFLCFSCFSVFAEGAKKEAVEEVKTFRWATSSTGSSGYRALNNLVQVIQPEMTGYDISVLPTAGAVFSVKSYCQGESEGYYGADIAFYELANNIKRFEGFGPQMKREPVQSFWSYTMEVGLAIHARNRGQFKEWRDLSGKRVFTGPMPWDVRATLERAMDAVGVNHQYVEVDTEMVASSLDKGDIAATIVYTAGEQRISPWLTQTEMAADLAVLNPSREEVRMLEEAGMPPVEVGADVFDTDVHVNKVSLVPFFYGLHPGMDMPAEDVYRMLTIIEEQADELAEMDASFAQIKADMAEVQQRGVKAAVDFVPVHPGLAKYMREKGVWSSEWNDRVAGE